jgi:hypothetical protein
MGSLLLQWLPRRASLCGVLRWCCSSDGGAMKHESAGLPASASRSANERERSLGGRGAIASDAVTSSDGTAVRPSPQHHDTMSQVDPASESNGGVRRPTTNTRTHAPLVPVSVFIDLDNVIQTRSVSSTVPCMLARRISLAWRCVRTHKLVSVRVNSRPSLTPTHARTHALH